MQISVADGSNYFRGLLLLIRKDRQVTGPEIALMKRIGQVLGFERGFCETAIRDILENPHIEDLPPVFSSQEIARKFIRDGLLLAHADELLHPTEVAWLQATAEENGLAASEFAEARENAAARKNLPGQLEVESLSVRYA